MKKMYDWALIQEEYNSGLSMRDLMNRYGMAVGTLVKAAKRGDLVTRTKSESLIVRQKLHGPITPSHSAETRKKISEGRSRYLRDNPDKVPYRINHSSNESYPEKIFRNALVESGITGWVSRYRIGIYEYDFAFVELKIDVEIDGDTHSQEKVKRIDARRDAWSRDNGWQVLRFSTKDVRRNVSVCIDALKKLIQQKKSLS